MLSQDHVTNISSDRETIVTTTKKVSSKFTTRGEALPCVERHTDCSNTWARESRHFKCFALSYDSLYSVKGWSAFFVRVQCWWFEWTVERKGRDKLSREREIDRIEMEVFLKVFLFHWSTQVDEKRRERANKQVTHRECVKRADENEIKVTSINYISLCRLRRGKSWIHRVDIQRLQFNPQKDKFENV